MRKYLATIHERPHKHKKAFAFAVSFSITLFIFGIWSFINFGVKTQIIADAPRDAGTLEPAIELGEIKSNIANSFEVIRGQVNSLQDISSTDSMNDNTYYGQ